MNLNRTSRIEPGRHVLHGRTFPLLALWPLLVFLPEFVFGSPSITRIVTVFFLVGLVFVLLVTLPRVQRLRSLVNRIELRSHIVVAAIVVLHAAVFIGAIVLRHQYFGAEHGEDTGYYNQIFWNTLNGEFFRGSITQERYFNPPVSSEFAIHNSPVMLLVLPFYALSPSFYTLLILRSLVLSLSAIPLYLLAKDKIGGVAGIVVIGAYFASANIFFQAVNGFYPLHLIALFLPLAFLYMHREQFWPFVLCLVLSLSVREEIALTAALFGVYAFFLKRSWRWVVVPIVVSAAWWFVSTELVMVQSRIAMEELDAFYTAFNEGHNGAVATVLEDPGKFARLLLTRDSFGYAYELVKPTAGFAFLTPAVLFIAPTLAVNCLIGAFMPATLSITYHYSIVAAVFLFVALIDGIGRLARHSPAFGVDRRTFCLGVCLLLLPGAVLGLTDSIRFGGGQGEPLVADFLPNPEQTTLEKILALVPAEASVAAPSKLLPHLSYRPRLYIADRLWRFGKNEKAIDEKQIDYIILDTDLSSLNAADRNRLKYEAVVEKTRDDPKYELLLSENGFEVFHRKAAPQP